jgi:hypothetical protein
MVKSTFLFLSFACLSCTLIRYDNEELTFQQTVNESKALRLDGYYFRERNTTTHSANILFLYNNGIIHDVGSLEPDNINVLNDEFFRTKVKNLRTCWGLYRITSDSIKFEKWYDGSGPPKVVFVRSGAILNDSTFQIIKVTRSNGEEPTKVNELYHFRHFHPKPDTTNAFIK